MPQQQQRLDADLLPFASNKSISDPFTPFGGGVQNPNLNQLFNEAYLRGLGTIVANSAPTKGGMNGLYSFITQLLTHIYQMGIPQWSANQSYFINSACVYNGIQYISLKGNYDGTDPNKGKEPSANPAYWQKVKASDADTLNGKSAAAIHNDALTAWHTQAIGTIITVPSKNLATKLIESARWKLCNGEYINKTTYATLFSLIGIEFGDGGVNFKLPDFSGKYLAYTNLLDSIATTAEQALPTLTISAFSIAHTHTATASSSSTKVNLAHTHNSTLRDIAAGTHYSGDWRGENLRHATTTTSVTETTSALGEHDHTITTAVTVNSAGSTDITPTINKVGAADAQIVRPPTVYVGSLIKVL